MQWQSEKKRQMIGLVYTVQNSQSECLELTGQEESKWREQQTNAKTKNGLS